MALKFNGRAKNDGRRLAQLRIPFNVDRTDIHLTVLYLSIMSDNTITRALVENTIRGYISAHGYAWQISMGDDVWIDPDVMPMTEAEAHDVVDDLFPELREDR